MTQPSHSASQSEPTKAYYVTLVGRVERDFLVYADTVKHAMQIMRGDREGAIALDDTYAEKGVIKPRRAPHEDRVRP